MHTEFGWVDITCTSKILDVGTLLDISISRFTVYARRKANLWPGLSARLSNICVNSHSQCRGERMLG